MSSLFDAAAFNQSLFFPRRDVSPTPDGARDLRVEVERGVGLHLRVYAAPGAHTMVLLFHGNGETVPDYDDTASEYARAAHASLAVVDYRGYGASDGRPTLRDCLHDAHPVLDALTAAVGALPVVVMGRSLGGACAAELCQRARPGVVGYVFESAPADVYGTLRRRGIMLDGPLSEADLAVFCPLRKLRRCETPALVLHGAEDTLIVPEEAERTFEALATRDKTRVMIPGRGHNDVSYHPRYWEALGAFVTRVAATSTPG